MFKEIIEFVTNLPKSPKDMDERFRKIPFSHKVFGIVTTAALTACAVGEKMGFVTPSPEGTKTPPAETSPTLETGLGMNINEIPVTQESFGGSLLKGEIIDVDPTDVATDTLKNKILAEFQESPFNPHSDLLTDPKIYGVQVLGSNLIDQSGNKQPFFFVRPFDKDGKPTTFDITDPSGVTYPAPFLFYTESDGKQFVPGGTGKEELGGRFLPVASYDAGELRYFGLVSSVSGGNINLNLFMTYDSKTGITAYTDPYSRQTTSWQEEPNKPLNDMFFPKLASLISYRSIPEPIIISTPIPEATPEDLNYSFSSAMDPEKLQAIMEHLSRQSDRVVNHTEDKGFPFIVAGGYIISYELTSVNGERSLYVLLVTRSNMLGVLKAKIDYVTLSGQPWPYPHLRVSELTSAQALEVSGYLNRVVYEPGTETDPYSLINAFSNIGMKAINNEIQAEICRKDLAPLDNAEQVCSYDSSLGVISPQEMESMIRNSIVSTKNKPPEEILSFDSPNPLLSAEGNAWIFLQVRVIH